MASENNNIRQSVVAVLLLLSGAIYALIGIARSPDGTTITNEAISTYLFKTGQRVVSRSNMTETIVQSASIATVLELTLSAEQLIGNGMDSCSVTAMVYDAAGNPVPDGQPVAFTLSRGKFLSGSDTAYTLTTQGQAVAWLKSELIVGGVPIFARVEAMTFGASGRSLTKDLPILFYGGGVKGKIISACNRAVPGIIVVAYDAARNETGRDTTKTGGSFFIPIERSGEYALAFRYRNAFDDDVVLDAPASVNVPTTGGVQAVAPLNTIVGNLINLATGQPVRKHGVSVMLYRTDTSSPNNGRTTPALQFTDERGSFAFDSLAPGVSEVNVIDVQLSGKLAVSHSEIGTFVIDANIAVEDSPTFEVTKNSNKRIVEMGDIVSYDVEVRNTSPDVTLSNVWLVDELPSSFVFAKGSAYCNGERLLDPTNNRHARWYVADTLQPGRAVKVTYSVNVGAGALESDGINKAHAIATLFSGDTARTAVASVQVVVRPGIFTDRGIVIGKVFYDENENAKQDEGEYGIAGVELWMEDGTRVLTGDDGKYSLPEVRPGQHVMRVNDRTLPYGSKLLALTSESAGEGLTRFIRLTEGGIARTDFYVRHPIQAALDAVFARATVQLTGERIPATYIVRLHEFELPSSISLLDTLPPGFLFDLNSITWRNMKLYPQGAHSSTLRVDFQKRTAQSFDTLQLSIVTDSAAIGKTLVTSGSLVLTYPHAKDAIFAARQLYGVIELRQAEPSVAKVATEKSPETSFVKQNPVSQTPTGKANDTVVHQSPAPDSSRHVLTAEQSHPRKRVGSKKPAVVKQPQTVAPEPKQQTAPNMLSGSPTATDAPSVNEESKIIPIAGLTAAGVLSGLIMFFLFRRRKLKGDRT